MARSRTKAPRLLDALFSILADPRGTTAALLNAKNGPRHAVTILIIFLGLYICAPLLYRTSGEPLIVRASTIAASLLALVVTIFLTSFFMMMGLRLLGTVNSLRSSFAAIAYSTSPLVSLMLLSLVACTLTRGEPTLFTFLATGFAASEDVVANIFPYLLRVTGVLSFTVLAQSIRALARASFGVSVALALAVIPMVLGSFVVGLTVADLIFPDSSILTIHFLQKYFG